MTVTGLLTGFDILHGYKPAQTADTVIIPNVMLKSDEHVFLDDCTVSNLEQNLGKKVLLFDATVRGLWNLVADQK